MQTTDKPSVGEDSENHGFVRWVTLGRPPPCLCSESEGGILRKGCFWKLSEMMPQLLAPQLPVPSGYQEVMSPTGKRGGATQASGPRPLSLLRP